MITASELFQNGLRLLKRGELRIVVEMATNSVQEFPDDGSLWELLGVACQRDGQHEKALHALETASLLKPLDIGARFCLAEAYAATGSHDLAVFVYRLVSEDPRTPVWLLPRVASHLGELQEFEHALDVCLTIVARDQSRHEAHFGIGFYLRRLGAETERIITSIQRAHDLSPATPLYRVVLASLRQELGQDADAYELLRQIPVESRTGAHSLHRMLLVFHTARDMQKLFDCARSLRQLEHDFPSTTAEGTD